MLKLTDTSRLAGLHCCQLHSKHAPQHTTCPEKRCHYIFASNFARYWPIFKILSSTDYWAVDWMRMWHVMPRIVSCGQKLLNFDAPRYIKINFYMGFATYHGAAAYSDPRHPQSWPSGLGLWLLLARAPLVMHTTLITCGGLPASEPCVTEMTPKR